MDLRSVYPFWLLNKGIVASYPSLDNNKKADVTIIGAGISGALVAWYLRNRGLKVIILDKRHVGMGSTAASTGLLQYEIDTPLVELEKKIGKKGAVESYLLCNKAIDELAVICGLFPEAAFTKRPSLQYASFKKDVASLKEEYQARKNIGLAIRLLDAQAIKDKFGFTKDAALFSANGAEVNAYALTHALLGHCTKKGLQVFDHTEVKTIRHEKRGYQLVTTENKKIDTRQLVIACGYESSRYISKQVDRLHSTYAIVSEPFRDKTMWYRNSLIWETAQPYLYLRNTQDHRILIGGKDDDFSSGHRRDKNLPRKAIELEAALKKLFPSIAFKTDFKWAGLFASTKDGLPYIGSLTGKPGMYFALGFGGNGIVFSVIAGQMIHDMIIGRKNKHAGIFGFNR